MASQSNPYLGGNVGFNSSPFTQNYLADLQRKHARQRALDDYYTNLTKSVNTAGVRTQDIQEGLAKKIDDWRNFGMTNREFLIDPRKDNYKALTEFQSRHQDILNDTEKSKAAAQMELEAGKRFFELQKDNTATDEDVNTVIPAHQASIYSPKHYKQDGVTPYNLSDLTFLAPLPTQSELKTFADLSVAGQKPSTTIANERIIKDKNSPFTGTRNFTEQTGFDDATLSKIGTTAAGLMSTPSLKRQFNDLYHDPATVEQYNPLFKKITGKDISSPQDMAAAFVIQQHSGTSNVDKSEKWTDQYGMQSALLNQREAFDARQLQKRLDAKKGDAKAQGQLLDDEMNKIQNIASQNPVSYDSYEVRNGKKELVRSEKQFIIPNAPKDMRDVLANSAIGKGAKAPDQLRISADGKFVIGIFTSSDPKDTDTKGRVAINNKLTTKLPISQFKLLYGKKLLGQKEAVAETADDLSEGASTSSSIDDDYIKSLGGTVR